MIGVEPMGPEASDASLAVVSEASRITDRNHFRALTADTTRLDLRRPSWRVRDQGQRGTCVAFAVAAAAELATTPEGYPPTTLSPQFLHWAIKTTTADPDPKHDGTWLAFARDALMQTGICEERLWPYSDAFLPDNIAHASASDPSASALENASLYKFGNVQYVRRTSGAASTVLSILGRGIPVVISVPVFRDPALSSGPNNWTTTVAWSYGVVLNPPPRSISVGGQAVCVVGFEPDGSEEFGGYFIFRNSWGERWALNAPLSERSLSPEPGYGVISASYVNDYLWELLYVEPDPEVLSISDYESAPPRKQGNEASLLFPLPCDRSRSRTQWSGSGNLPHSGI
jgi:hypothetical protein